MDNIRTSTLFHFTGRFETLTKILEEGLKANFCKEDFSFLGDEKYVVGIPMISLCDIPLTRITKVSERYGKYGIGLSKTWGVKNEINPILYLRSMHLKKVVRKVYEINSSESTNKDISDIYLRSFIGFSKLHTGIYDRKKQCNYDENEWRYVKSDHPIENQHSWKWGIDNYNNWRGEGDKPQSIFSPKTFTVDDINFIIVEEESEIPELINHLDSMINKVLGGVAILESMSQKTLLTKIISIERIKKDF